MVETPRNQPEPLPSHPLPYDFKEERRRWKRVNGIEQWQRSEGKLKVVFARMKD